MQLSRRARAPGAKKRGFVATGAEIVKRETPLGLYKGLGAVVTGIVPKMAIRFTSFEAYKQLLADDKGHVSGQATFLGEFFFSFCLSFMSNSRLFWRSSELCWSSARAPRTLGNSKIKQFKIGRGRGSGNWG